MPETKSRHPLKDYVKETQEKLLKDCVFLQAKEKRTQQEELDLFVKVGMLNVLEQVEKICTERNRW